MNLSETAFVLKGAHGYALRWFTPLKEVRLCGHATLAAAHVLFERGFVRRAKEVVFHTKSGPIAAVKKNALIEMDFPVLPFKDATCPAALKKALGCGPLYTGRTRFDFLVELPTEKAVVKLRPDFSLLRKIPARGFMVTARSKRIGFDFVSRFFAPSIGIDEDPVTGSAHSSLALFWAERFKKKTFVAYQASQRGGVLRVRLEKGRVLLSGKASTVSEGRLVDGFL